MGAMASFLYENPADPWEEIETPWGKLPAWKASTLATGTMGAMDTYMRHVRADAADATSRIADAQARTDALDEREAELNRREGELTAKLALFNDAVTRFADMVEREVQRKADAEPLPLPPTEEPEEPEELPADPPRGDEGDLEPLQAKGEEPYPLLPDPPEEDDSEGDLPKDLRIPELGNYPTLLDPPKLQVAQPIAISLNAEEDD
jgi:hypothetical protein